MPTPILTPSTVNLSLSLQDKQTVVATVRDEDGAPIDISSGWGVQFVAFPQAARNPNYAGFNVGALCTPVLNADGTVEFPFDYNDFRTTAPAMSLYYAIVASNDSFTTSGIVQQGRLTLSAPSIQ